MNLIKTVVYAMTGTRNWREFILFLAYGAFLLWFIFDILGVYS